MSSFDLASLISTGVTTPTLENMKSILEKLNLLSHENIACKFNEVFLT